MFKHILISTDGSPLANKAAKAGIALAHALRRADAGAQPNAAHGTNHL